MPARQKRHGRSTALLIPMRVPLWISCGLCSHDSRGGWIVIGPRVRSQSLCSSPIASATVSLPGPEQSSSRLLHGATLAHARDAAQRLQRADQHRGADALLLADGVQQRVDAVGAVDVGASGATEQRAGARGETDEGVAGRLVLVVGLGLNDHAGGGAVFDDAADQCPCDLHHRPPVELDGQRARRRPARRTHGEARPTAGLPARQSQGSLDSSTGGWVSTPRASSSCSWTRRTRCRPRRPCSQATNSG